MSDAFGRKSKEDPLQEMGWTDADTSATTTPVETSQTSTGTPVDTPARDRTPERDEDTPDVLPGTEERRGSIAIVMAALVVLAGLAVVVAALLAA